MTPPTLKPSHFTSFPMGSLSCKRESEIVASNIMRIRARTGDEWPITWDAYRTERLKDGEFTESERYYFDGVLPMISDADGAVRFSPSWAANARAATGATSAPETVPQPH